MKKFVFTPKMTRKEWELKALRAAERELCVPPGWWGNYQTLYAPNGATVTFSRVRSAWLVRDKKGVIISVHDARAGAIRKAKTL